MNISRRTVIPVVLAMVMVGSLTALFSAVTLPGQFERWARLSDMENWALAARWLHRVHALGPAIPVLFLAFGIGLARPRECRATILAWYLCTAAVVTASWLAWTILVLLSFHGLAQPS